jgi:isoquinoline 1-oxidoreductase alpha subunit
MISLNVNGKLVQADADGDTPLLWVLRDHLDMTGTKFGCGMALCGACTVHIDGKPTRSCVTPASAVVGKQIVTVEKIGESRAGKAVQAAWAAESVPQCGYCQSGQVMAATALLAAIPAPSDAAPTRASARPSSAQRRRWHEIHHQSEPPRIPPGLRRAGPWFSSSTIAGAVGTGKNRKRRCRRRVLAERLHSHQP